MTTSPETLEINGILYKKIGEEKKGITADVSSFEVNNPGSEFVLNRSGKDYLKQIAVEYFPQSDSVRYEVEIIQVITLGTEKIKIDYPMFGHKAGEIEYIYHLEVLYLISEYEMIENPHQTPQEAADNV